MPAVDATLPAFAGAALFAVHPIQSEAVAYMSGRSEVLSAVWFLAALLFGAGGNPFGSVPRLRFSAAACGFLALASKETALALPVVFLAYDWLLRPGPDDASAEAVGGR